MCILPVSLIVEDQGLEIPSTSAVRPVLAAYSARKPPRNDHRYPQPCSTGSHRPHPLRPATSGPGLRRSTHTSTDQHLRVSVGRMAVRTSSCGPRSFTRQTDAPSRYSQTTTLCVNTNVDIHVDVRVSTNTNIGVLIWFRSILTNGSTSEHEAHVYRARVHTTGRPSIARSLQAARRRTALPGTRMHLLGARLLRSLQEARRRPSVRAPEMPQRCARRIRPLPKARRRKPVCRARLRPRR